MIEAKYPNHDVSTREQLWSAAITSIGLPSWLLADKTTLADGIAQFQRKGYLNFRHFSARGDHKTPYDAQAFSKLLSPLSSRELNVDLETAGMRMIETQSGSWPWSCYFIDSRDIEYLTSLFKDAAANSVMKALSIHLPIWAFEDERQSIDLESLRSAIAEVVPMLSSLRVSIDFDAHLLRVRDAMAAELVKETEKFAGVTEGMKCNVNGDMKAARRETVPEREDGWDITWVRGKV